MAQKKKTEIVRSRQSILDLLKRHGSISSIDLAEAIEVTPMAVRQHLYKLQDEQLVSFTTEAQPMGRPIKLWELTKKAQELFPDAHAELLVDLVGSVEKVFGKKGLEKLVSQRGKEQIEQYRTALESCKNLRERVKKLAAIRTKEGYMANYEKSQDGSYLLIENHCPICAAATRCQQFCSSEHECFQEVLGSEVLVERVEHVIQGAKRCVYNIKELSK